MEEALEIVHHVESWYDSAWIKLMVVLSLGFGVIGILLPYFQMRRESGQEEKIRLSLSKELTKDLTISITEKIKSEYEEELSEIKKNIDGIYGITYDIRGRLSVDAKDYVSGLSDCLHAANHFIRADDNFNVGGALDNILICIPNMDKKSFNRSFSNVNSSFVKFEEIVTGYENRDIGITQKFVKIKEEIEKLK